VLVLAGAEDHFVPITQFYDQLRALTGARSITGRVFTRAEHAQAHCHVGNLALAAAEMTGWIQLQTEKGQGEHLSPKFPPAPTPS
jgi:hypothetical protein